MTSDRDHTGEKTTVSIREWMSFGLAFAVASATVGYSYFNNQADGHVTANQVKELSVKLDEVSRKISDMPRASDYADIQAHLGRVDNAFGAVGDRFNRDELSAAETATKVQRLWEGSTTPLRTPR